MAGKSMARQAYERSIEGVPTIYCNMCEQNVPVTQVELAVPAQRYYVVKEVEGRYKMVLDETFESDGVNPDLYHHTVDGEGSRDGSCDNGLDWDELEKAVGGDLWMP